ncbi:MAG: NADH:flavin oxidoreductase [Desulfosalsimonadaceae bacterium]
MYSRLFSGIDVGGRQLANRIVMVPLYLGYAGEGGTVSPLLLEHYRMMAESGAAMITVENATVDHPEGSGSNRTIRIDTDENLSGLRELAGTIKQQGALACIQINHAGRFAGAEEPVAPSAVDTFGRMPRALTVEEISRLREKFASAAARAKSAGFDMVELHGGTGYLLSQFLSPRTNKRDDAYGGSLENRMQFFLEVLAAAKKEAGDMPVGCRLLADEYLPDGLGLQESKKVAAALSEAGTAYISVMGGTYESFTRPEIIENSRAEGYMADLAGEIRKHVRVPVTAAGRISSGRTAEDILAAGKADLVGLARVLWADPEWPEKVKNGREDEIVACDPDCGDVCMQLVMQGKPAYCTQWPPEKTRRLKDLFR